MRAHLRNRRRQHAAMAGLWAMLMRRRSPQRPSGNLSRLGAAMVVRRWSCGLCYPSRLRRLRRRLRPRLCCRWRAAPGSLRFTQPDVTRTEPGAAVSESRGWPFGQESRRGSARRRGPYRLGRASRAVHRPGPCGFDASDAPPRFVGPAAPPRQRYYPPSPVPRASHVALADHAPRLPPRRRRGGGGGAGPGPRRVTGPRAAGDSAFGPAAAQRLGWATVGAT